MATVNATRGAALVGAALGTVKEAAGALEVEAVAQISLVRLQQPPALVVHLVHFASTEAEQQPKITWSTSTDLMMTK